MLVWILSIVKGFGRTCQERGTETKQINRNHFSVDTHRSGVLSCRLLTTIEGTSSVRARHTRGRRRPLGPEELATLALRKLNRQPVGVLARNWPTFRLHHHRKACMQKETGVGLTLYTKADRNRREHLPAKASEAAVAGNPRWPPSLSVCAWPAARRDDPPHRHHTQGSISKFYATL